MIKLDFKNQTDSAAKRYVEIKPEKKVFFLKKESKNYTNFLNKF